MMAISFQWDLNKDAYNRKRHGISFDEASTVFYDENALLIHDPDHSVNENRYILMGISRKLNILIVCHCYKEKNQIIRIISARKATRKEKEKYLEARKI
ncbi:MAG: BrnT family toxin [bacterium]|nr:BrnT family toxin [bacterium]